MTPAFSHKLVAVLNESLEPGVIMNALAHMCIGLGSEIGKEPLRLSRYQDADGGSHPFISEMPFIILKANSNKIRALRQEVLQDPTIKCNDFIHTMTGGTYLEQLEHTSKTKEADLIYYGIVLFGDWQAVSALTKKFSLWK